MATASQSSSSSPESSLQGQRCEKKPGEINKELPCGHFLYYGCASELEPDSQVLLLNLFFWPIQLKIEHTKLTETGKLKPETNLSVFVVCQAKIAREPCPPSCFDVHTIA